MNKIILTEQDIKHVVKDVINEIGIGKLMKFVKCTGYSGGCDLSNVKQMRCYAILNNWINNNARNYDITKKEVIQVLNGNYFDDVDNRFLQDFNNIKHECARRLGLRNSLVTSITQALGSDFYYGYNNQTSQQFINMITNKAPQM